MKNTELNTDQLSSLKLATAYLDALEARDAEAISDMFADNVYHSFPFNVTGDGVGAVQAKVEYYLTEIGTALVPICNDLHNWGTKHRLVHIGMVSAAVHGMTT